MTDLLPILFNRGQNESIDPRVAPAEVHRVAQNVRWRKDGRPAKRFGLTALATTGLDSGGSLYTSQAVNAVSSWNGAPLLVLGAGVRQLLGTTWTDAQRAAVNEISHWGPGERSTVISSESVRLQNASVAYANGYVLYTWDDGASVNVRICDATTGAPVYTGGGGIGSIVHSRCIAVGNLFYVFVKAGTSIFVFVIDTTTTLALGTIAYTFTATSASNFDVCSRGSSWLIIYQTSTTVLTLSIMTGANPPVASVTKTTTTPTVTSPLMGIAGTATSAIFFGWLDVGSGGLINVKAYDNALTTLAFGTTVDTDANNADQLGICIEDNHNARLVWGGYVALQTSYMRISRISDTGTGVALTTFYGLRAASKPFQGPAYATLGNYDGPYIWTHTHNSDAANTGTKWDDQRTYLLMRLPSNLTSPTLGLTRQMHVPNMVATVNQYTAHLADSISTPFGFFTALTNATRFGGTGATESYSIESIGSHSIRESQRYAARSTALAGRAVQISGGSLYEFTSSAEESGFSNAPVIQLISGSAGGNLTASSNYLYRAVYEWIDLQGRRHRSTPSDPFAFASGTNGTATLNVHPAVSASRLLGTSLSLHIYRTLAGQSTYHRVTPNLAPPSGAPAASVSYVDTMSDANAALGEFIYTDGGVLDNSLPPPCTFMTVCNGRVWLGGQLDRCVVTASKLLVDGEPTQFSDSPVFDTFLPHKCTGIAALDGTVVAFARERIYLIQGDGPNDQGVGQFNPPQELPTDVGCIDWRSVVETSLGIFFQSKRGIFLLPRGFNTPVFIGAEVEDTLRAFPIVLSAALVSVPSNKPNATLGEITVRFVVGSAEIASATCVLVYDMRTGGWSVDSTSAGNPYGLCGTWNDTFVVTKAGQFTGTFTSVSVEDPSTFAEESTFIPTQLGTGDIRPFGVGGYGQFNKVLMLGEFRGNCTLTAQVSVDGGTPDAYVFTLTSPITDSFDGSVYLDVTPKIQKGSAIRVTTTDGDSGFAGTEGFIMQALFIESELIGKTKRLPAGRKA